MKTDLLLRLVIMSESLKETKDNPAGIEEAAARAICGGVAQRLNATYGSYENMSLSQQQMRAGVVNMRQSWGHLCYQSTEQYEFGLWREYNLEKALWGQAYAMAIEEKILSQKIKNGISNGERLDPNYLSKRPTYMSLSILYNLEEPWAEDESRRLVGYRINNHNAVGNLFENVVSAAVYNREPWRVSQFLNDPKQFIADVSGNSAVRKYYQYMSSQLKQTDKILKKKKDENEKKRIVAEKAAEEKKIADAKAAKRRKLQMQKQPKRRKLQMQKQPKRRKLQMQKRNLNIWLRFPKSKKTF
jgi:hypothetical protein